MKAETVDDALSRLREGKRELRSSRSKMSLPQKVREVVELQKIYVTAARGRRVLTERERVWPMKRR